MGQKATIDQERCQGHGRCTLIAPDLFDIDDEGLGTVLVPQIPDEALADARESVLSCPESAITLDG